MPHRGRSGGPFWLIYLVLAATRARVAQVPILGASFGLNLIDPQNIDHKLSCVGGWYFLTLIISENIDQQVSGRSPFDPQREGASFHFVTALVKSLAAAFFAARYFYLLCYFISVSPFPLCVVVTELRLELILNFIKLMLLQISNLSLHQVCVEMQSTGAVLCACNNS